MQLVAPQIASQFKPMGTESANPIQALAPPPPITGSEAKTEIQTNIEQPIRKMVASVMPAAPRTPEAAQIKPPPPPFPPDKVVEWVRSLPTPLEMIESLPFLRDFGDPISDAIRVRKNFMRLHDDSHAMAEVMTKETGHATEDTRRMSETMHRMTDAIWKVANWKLPFT